MTKDDREGREGNVENVEGRPKRYTRDDSRQGARHGRLHVLEARQDELTALPAAVPDIHPNVAAIYRRKVGRLAEALKRPDERAEAADASRGLIERIVLAPGEKWGEVHATLHDDIATIVEWTGNGGGKGGTGMPAR
ncbi:MAG: hypothetical protein OXQ84_17550 [bacterium]|nr:hypothetical protein [bacterium]